MVFVKRSKKQNVVDSPDALFRELTRRNIPDVLPHQRDMMRMYANDAQDKADVAMQLPTGSGKTLVGLLIAEWRRRKNNEKIVFLCPTKQLVNQVVEQAETKYGINVVGFTGKKSEYDPTSITKYKQGMAVAVTTYSSIFNTNPFFDDPDVIIIDDAHSAENYIAKMWSLEISRFEDEALYSVLCELIKPYIDVTSYSKLMGEWEDQETMSWVDKLPTPIFMLLKDDLIEIIDEYSIRTKLQFSWSMIREHLQACHFYFSAKGILIRPLIAPTWMHKPFVNATQRIFMSATLGEGGDLERLMGRKNIFRLSIPEGWDIQGVGRRFFMFPSHSLSEEQINQMMLKLLSKVDRSLILVPNDAQSNNIQTFIEEQTSLNIYNASDIEESKNDFITDNNAVAVIANRYDGIDFPKDECRLLIIGGLPKTVNLQEQFFMSKMGASALFNERVQTRVIQAIGRCTRSLEDYSAVVIMGTELVDYLSDIKRRHYFHPELQAELEFGVDQSMNSTIDNFCENFDVFIKNGEEWEEVNKDILEIRDEKAQRNFPGITELESIVNLEIDYVKALWGSDMVEAMDKAEEILSKLSSSELQGYRALWHYLAGSCADQAKHISGIDLNLKAQQHWLNAKKSTSSLPWLANLSKSNSQISLTLEENYNILLMKQIENLERVFEKIGITNSRKFLREEKFIRDGLRSSKEFEEAHKKLGELLGFDAGKIESDASPDPWWQLENICFVFEDHANATNDILDATKARQASSHPNWMREHVDSCKDKEVDILPVLVSPVTKMTEGAVAHVNILSYWKLSEFLDWSDNALSTIKDIRATFQEVGDLMWRAEAATKLKSAKIDIINIQKFLVSSLCRDRLSVYA